MKFTAVSRPAADGDKVTVDFDGSIDGTAFAGGKGESVPIVLGEGRMLAQLEGGLAGASPGESREIGVDFPADYRATELAGKHAVIQGRREIRRGGRRSRRSTKSSAPRSASPRAGWRALRGRSCAQTCSASSSRACAIANKATVMEKLYQENPRRRAERAARVADPGHADRDHAAHRREGRLAGPAARALGGARAAAA